MHPPPLDLDGAPVLYWAGASSPFYYVQDYDTHEQLGVQAMAVCRYPGDVRVYLFLCDDNWDILEELDAPTVDEVKAAAESLARGQALRWRPVET